MVVMYELLVSATQSINLCACSRFESGYHGDEDPFDGPGGILDFHKYCTYLPTTKVKGEINFFYITGA
jgi:hypothetical protein